MGRPQQVARPVEWLYAPNWLTLEQACTLSGWDTSALLTSRIGGIIDEGGVDTDAAGLVERDSLLEFQESAALLLHWND